jgi:cytochrome P450
MVDRLSNGREIASWPHTEPFALHPRMQAVTLEVILSAVFGITNPQRRTQLRQRLPILLSNTSSVGLQLRFMLSRRLITQTEARTLREPMRPLSEPRSPEGGR